MLQTHTGALQTAPQPPRAVMLLEDGLEKVAGAVAELLLHAREIDPRTDEYGHARSRAYSDAVAMLKASAKVGHTIAELSGSKFEHNINVRRDEPAQAQEASTPAPTGPGFGFQGRIRLTDGRVCMRAPNNRWRIIEEDCDCHEQNREDSPTPISEGSNGNFAPSAGREDASRGQVDATAAAQPDSAAAEFAKTADDDSDEGDSCLRYQGCEIDPNVGLPDGQRYVYGKAWMHVPDDWDEEAWRRTQNEGGERGTPTPISKGSNGNSGRSGDDWHIDGEDYAAFAAAGPNATDAEREAAASALERAVLRLERAAVLSKRSPPHRHRERGTPTPISGGSNGNFTENDGVRP